MSVPPEIRPVRRLKVADSVAAQLERLITDGGFVPGDRLPAERVLAEQFGVGRSSMREALRMVEALGLVRTDHGVGVIVVRTERRAPSASELLLLDEFTVGDLFEVRLPLEDRTASLAARRVTPAMATKLYELLEAASDPDLSDAQFIELDGALHQAIAETAGNPLLLGVFKNLAPLCVRYSERVIALPGRRARAHLGHQAIVDAIVGRRVRDARAAAARHIREVEQDVLAHLAQSSPPAEGP